MRSLLISLGIVLSFEGVTKAHAADGTCANNWSLNAYFTTAEKQAIVDSHAQADPAFRNALTSLFQSKKRTINATLTQASSKYNSINDDGLALVFAGVLAYELWSNCSPRGASTLDLDYMIQHTMLAAGADRRGVLCQGYVSLTMQIFYRFWTPQSAFSLTAFGLDREAMTDNHTMIAATGTGVSLWVDPMTSGVAPISLFGMMSGSTLSDSDFVRFSSRNEPSSTDPTNMNAFFNLKLKPMIRDGLFDSRALMYVYGTKDAKGNNRFLDASPNLRTQQVVDFIQKMQWFNVNSLMFWGVFGKDQRLKQVSEAGLTDVGYNVQGIEAANRDVYVLLTGRPGTVLVWRHGTGGFAYLMNGGRQVQATSIASGPGNNGLWYVNGSGVLWYVNSTGQFVQRNSGNTKTVVTTGDVLFMLTTYGYLYKLAIGAGGFSLVATNTGSIFATYPGRAPMQCALAQSDPACRGHVARLDNYGQRSGDLNYLGSSGAWSLVRGGVSNALPSYRRTTVNFITATGVVCDYATFSVWSQPFGGVKSYNSEIIPASKWFAQDGSGSPSALPVWQRFGVWQSGLSTYGPYFSQVSDGIGRVYITVSDRSIPPGPQCQ